MRCANWISGAAALLALGCGADDDAGPKLSNGNPVVTAGSGTSTPPAVGQAGSAARPGAGTAAVGAGAAGATAAHAGSGAVDVVRPAPGGTAAANAGQAATLTAGTSGAAAGTSAGAAGMIAQAGGTSAPPTAAGEPKIPPIVGECPMFKTGTASIGGLSGISMQVGEMKAEKGSLLFYWHGTGQAAGMANQSVPAAVRKEILDAGGIIVSPSGSLGTGGDCSGTGTFYKDDFKVADLITACGVKDHNIDPKRIYTTGCSAGGLQAGCMAVMRASYLAASAPNSGGIIGMQPKDDPHVPALFTMHGGASDMVIVTFSETSNALDMQLAKMGGFVVNCNHGGGHCGAPAALQTAAWQFMKDHPFGTPSPYLSGGLPASFPDYCKVFSSM
jgi:hypothetical protein